jgi:hypothetical protein
MGEFQLIILSEVDRTAVRQAPRSGAFSLIQFRRPAGVGMGINPNQADDDGKITAEEMVGWYTPIEAAAYAAQIVGSKAAGDAIWQLLVAGIIEAAASNSSRTVEDYSPTTNTEPSLIPTRFWRHISKAGTDLWSAGYARFWLAKGHYGKKTAYQFFGIKLNPHDVHSGLPPLPPPSPKPPEAEPPLTIEAPPVNKSGRPRKDWWDDFWIDICGQIYVGDLKPKRQADLEKAMLDWATNRGSEATARKTAKKPFIAWKLGG